MLPLDILSPYACKDADATFQLYDKFKPLIDKNSKFSYVYEELLKSASKILFLRQNSFL